MVSKQVTENICKKSLISDLIFSGKLTSANQWKTELLIKMETKAAISISAFILVV